MGDDVKGGDVGIVVGLEGAEQNHDDQGQDDGSPEDEGNVEEEIAPVETCPRPRSPASIRGEQGRHKVSPVPDLFARCCDSSDSVLR